jgi:hypothetical protein
MLSGTTLIKQMLHKTRGGRRGLFHEAVLAVLRKEYSTSIGHQEFDRPWSYEVGDRGKCGAREWADKFMKLNVINEG